jgi:hypothetical protein
VGETVLLDQEVVLTTMVLCSKVVAVIRRESPSSILVNFYVFPGENGIQVPHLPVPQKRTYNRFPTQEVVLCQCLLLVEDRLQALFFINEYGILLG